jgi:uncharacterized radical SAM superfamily protein
MEARNIDTITTLEKYNKAYNTTQSWLKQHQDYLSTLISEEKNGFVPLDYYINQLFYYKTENTYISLGFHKSINYAMSVNELQKNINYISLDRIPLPDFIIPDGWDIYPQTPISSINSDKLDILSFENGKIKIHVKADFFAIHGYLKNFPYFQDAPMPKGTYFQIKKDLKGDIFIYLPITITN